MTTYFKATFNCNHRSDNLFLSHIQLQPQEWQLISKPHSTATTGVTTYFKATFNCNHRSDNLFQSHIQLQPQEWQLISKPHSTATTGVTTYFKATFNCNHRSDNLFQSHIQLQPQEWQLISKPHSTATTGVTTYFKATFNCITRIHSIQSDIFKSFLSPSYKTNIWVKHNIFENLPVTLILFLINLFLCQLEAALFGPTNWQSSVLTLSLLSS